MFTEGHEDRGRELSVRLGNVEGGGTFPIGFIFPVVDMQLMHDHTEDNVLDEVIEERRTHNFAFPGMVGKALEVRLAGCLTALEAILLGDDDYSNHVTYIARRLSALTGFYEFDDISCFTEHARGLFIVPNGISRARWWCSLRR